MRKFRLNIAAALVITAWGGIAFDAPDCWGALSIRDEAPSASSYDSDHEIVSIASAAASPMLKSDSFAVLQGDTNLDGTVSFFDLNTVLSQYGQSGVWSSGDFNGDGFVSFTDLNDLLSNYGQSLPVSSGPAVQVVPEPASKIIWACLGCLAGCLELFRRQVNWRKTASAGCVK